MNTPTIVLLLLVLTAPGLSQHTKEDGAMKDCPIHEQHSGHHAVAESRGDQAMGFPHDATTHHFRLMSNGGVIEVIANRQTAAANDSFTGNQPFQPIAVASTATPESP